MTYREAVFFITDSLKQFSDDNVWEPEHIIKFIHKYRSLLFKQRYLDRKKEIPLIFYQKLNVDLDVYTTVKRSRKIIPYPIDNQLINTYTYISLDDLAISKVGVVSPQRFELLQYNKWTSTMPVASIMIDGHLMIRNASNYSSVIMYTILDNPIDADIFNGVNTLDVLDLELPCDESLFQSIVELIVREMSALNGLPRDISNNANDDVIANQNSRKD